MLDFRRFGSYIVDSDWDSTCRFTVITLNGVVKSLLATPDIHPAKSSCGTDSITCCEFGDRRSLFWSVERVKE
jgi:hypothetical protein